MQKSPQFSKWHLLLNEKQKKPFVLLNDQGTIIHWYLNTASLAQVDKALNHLESNLFCRDTGSIWGWPIFFFVLFLYFLQKPRYLFNNKLHIERDLDTDFLHRLLWCVNWSSVKANTIWTDGKEMWCIRALSTNILSIVLTYLVTCLVVERHPKAFINL